MGKKYLDGEGRERYLSTDDLDAVLATEEGEARGVFLPKRELNFPEDTGQGGGKALQKTWPEVRETE